MGWPELPEIDVLALLLLAERERGAASAWSAWLPTLPTTFDLPSVWGDEAVAELRCPIFTARVREARACALRGFAGVQEAFASRPHYSLPEQVSERERERNR